MHETQHALFLPLASPTFFSKHRIRTSRYFRPIIGGAHKANVVQRQYFDRLENESQVEKEESEAPQAQEKKDKGQIVRSLPLRRVHTNKHLTACYSK